MVGVYGQANKATLDHERAHAYYTCAPGYSELFTAQLDGQEAVYQALREMGYGEHVLLDERQAYAVSGWRKDWPQTLREQLRDLIGKPEFAVVLA